MGRTPGSREVSHGWNALADITYLPLRNGGFCYLAGLMDRSSRDLVGWALDASMTESLVSGALRRAIRERQPKAGLVHHSDRGGQYAGTQSETAPGLRAMPIPRRAHSHRSRLEELPIGQVLGILAG